LLSGYELWRHYRPKFWLGRDVMRVSYMKRLIFAAAVAAAAFSACAASQAAELGPGYRSGAAHVRTTGPYWNWRDRCAWAGYYCLYAYDGYVYAYPWDDRPSAIAYSARRHRHRF